MYRSVFTSTIIISVHASSHVFYTDVNECDEGTDLCDSNADCTNTIGSYECTCTVGYSGNGNTCGKNARVLDIRCILVIPMYI